jgi:Tol biopolymer transport system component
MTEERSAPSLAPGLRLGPYEIKAPIGAGGMGEVYRATDTRLGRDVALKLLPRAFASDPDRVARFEREARAVAGLSHPNILALFDVGTHDGTVYAVTELLEGETLRARLAGGPLPARKATDYAAQAARGLAAAHDKGIVHRDLKPENLFVTGDGRVKVLDFGLARFQAPAGAEDTRSPTLARPTDAGSVLGTVGYMSPEQVRGEPVDTRSDIFSLGCVLYEMLSGRRAFLHETAAETMTAILREDPPELAGARVSPALERVIRRCLEKKPGERFRSAEDLAFALETVGGGSESGVSGVTAPLRSRLGDGRIPAAAGILAALALGAAAGYWMRGRGADPALPSPAAGSFLQVTDFPGVERQPSLSADGRTVVYVSDTFGNDDLYLLRVGGRNPVNLTADSPAPDYAPSFSPDGTKIAFRSERAGGGVFVMEATGESVRRVSDFGHDPSWSHDGRDLLVSTEAIVDPMSRIGQSELWAVNVEDGRRRRVLTTDAVSPRASPHGHRIAYWSRKPGRPDRDIFTVRADARDATEKDEVAVTLDSAVDWNPEWSPDGRFLYFSSNRGGTLNLWRVPIDEASGRTLGPPQPVTTPSTWCGWISFARDGSRLAFADLDDRSTVWTAGFDARSEKVLGSPQRVLRARGILSIDWSPDAAALAFTQRGQPWETLGVVKADGSGLARLTEGSYFSRLPAWSPDGERIAFYSTREGETALWTIRPDGSGLQRISKPGPGVVYPAWSPDGSRIAVNRDDELAFYDLGGALPADPAGPGIRVGARQRDSSEPAFASGFLPYGWSPDGRRVVGEQRRSFSGALYGRRGVVLYEPVTGRDLLVSEDGNSPEWLPDSRRLLMGSSGRIVVLDTATGVTHAVLPDAGLPQSWGHEIALSRDGRQLAWIEAQGEGDVWILELKAHGAEPGSPD